MDGPGRPLLPTDAHLNYLRAGAKRAGRGLNDLDIQIGATVAFGDDLRALIAPLKPRVAFTLGAMESPQTDFYNGAFKRGGWKDVAGEVQWLWVAREREAAVAHVLDEMVIQTNLLGDDHAVRERIRIYQRAGVTALRLSPAGDTVVERLETLGRAMDLVRAVDAQ